MTDYSVTVKRLGFMAYQWEVRTPNGYYFGFHRFFWGAAAEAQEKFVEKAR